MTIVSFCNPEVIAAFRDEVLLDDRAIMPDRATVFEMTPNGVDRLIGDMADR